MSTVRREAFEGVEPGFGPVQLDLFAWVTSWRGTAWRKHDRGHLVNVNARPTPAVLVPAR